MLVGPADVHAHEHLGPVRGVDATGAGANVDEGVALVVLARQQRAHLHGLDIGAQGLALGIGVGQRGGHGIALFALGELVEHGQVFETLPQFLDTAQFTLRMGELTGDLLGVFLVVPQVGIGRLMFELVDATTQLFHIENRLHRPEGRCELGQVCGNIGMHDSLATG